VLGTMTNFAIRAADVQAELEFLRVFGARSVLRNERVHEGETVERFHLDLGAMHVVLFDRGSIDARLEALGVTPSAGVSHVAFEVGSTERLIAAAAERKIEPLIPTFKVAASPTGGPRLITYFRSPNGTVIETKELVSS
jgi:catechol 2,3-dioxygenase-like lactoylglutathione lyase family enzyme